MLPRTAAAGPIFSDGCEALLKEAIFLLKAGEKAVSIPILKEEFRERLVNEANSLPMEKRPEIFGPFGVRQRFSGFDGPFAEDSLFLLLTRKFEDLLNSTLVTLEVPPFPLPIHFNDLSLQKYEKGKLGITPHRDHARFVNIICIFMIEGRCRFCICKDREGTDPQEVDSSPGNVIVMKAPGFFNQREQPFHFVEDIPSLRYSFTLRVNSDPSNPAGAIRQFTPPTTNS